MVGEPGLSLKHILKLQNAIHFGPSNLLTTIED